LEKRLKQCGLCAGWTADGENLPSGNRDLKTGRTPMDNFVCTRCKRECETNWFVRRQCEEMIKDAA